MEDVRLRNQDGQPWLVTKTTMMTSLRTAPSQSPWSPHHQAANLQTSNSQTLDMHARAQDSTVNGVVIGLLSSLGSALLIAIIFAIVWFLRYTGTGRILLERMGRPGEFDDEAAFAREEADALEEMDEGERGEYLRAKGTFFVSIASC